MLLPAPLARRDLRPPPIVHRQGRAAIDPAEIDPAEIAAVTGPAVIVAVIGRVVIVAETGRVVIVALVPVSRSTLRSLSIV